MRKMGAELEFRSWSDRATTQNSLNTQINAIADRQQMICRTNESPDYWTMKTDHCGWELTTPAFKSTNNNFIKIYKIIEDLRREICYRHNVCNNPGNTGFHVHCEVGDLSSSQLRNLINIFRTFEPALYSIQHRRRTENSWCRPLSGYFTPNNDRESRISTFSRNNINLMSEHYCAVNFGRYGERKTIEIRYGAATIRGRKVINWMQLLCFMVEAAKSVENYQFNECGELEDLAEFMRSVRTGTWLDRRVPKLIAWMNRRHQALYHRREWQAGREARQEARTARIAAVNTGEEIAEPTSEAIA